MNINLLKSKLALQGVNVERLSEKMAWHGAEIKSESIYRKMRGVTEFTRIEIIAISKALKLTDEEIMDIFFN